MAADFARRTSAQAWLPLLADIDAVVNCVGVLQGARDDTWRVHVEATTALFEACARAGVRRRVIVSAIGAEHAGPTSFARSKAEAEARLGSISTGSSCVRRSCSRPRSMAPAQCCAGSPGCWLAPMIGGESRIQIVSIDDVAQTVALALAAVPPQR